MTVASQSRAEPRAGLTRWRLASHALGRFWDVHTWAGVITGLLVYVMFVLGAVVLFYRPLTIWEEPIMQKDAPEIHSVQSVASLVADLPEEFYLYLPYERRGLPKIGYYLPKTTAWTMWWLDPTTSAVIPQRELAAAYIYDLHYLWHNATGYWLQYGAGILVFGFLLAIATGVLIHLGSVFRQLHRFRPEAPSRLLWSDLHKVTGVFGLPFQLVYALTGTLMALSPLLFELSVGPVFDGDVAKAVATAGALVDDPPPLDYGARITPISLDRAIAQARAVEPRLTVESLVVHGFPYEHGSVDVRGPIAGEPFGEGTVRVRLRDAQVEEVQTPDGSSAVGSVVRTIHGLHTVEYGGWLARVFVLLLALSACATILTGNWIWLERRGRRARALGNVVLARLTVGVGAGAPLSVGALLLASRLLPLEAPTRTRDEVLAMAFTMLAALVVAFVRTDARATARQLLALAALGFAVLPWAATLHSPHGLLGAGPSQDTVVAVELGFVGLSGVLLGLVWIGRRLRMRQSS